MSLTKWRKNSKLSPALTPFAGWVDQFFKDDEGFLNRWNWENTLPAVNIKDTKESYNLEVAAPGMKKEDFKIAVENGMLRISAETQAEQEDKSDDYARKEFSYQSFSRSFWLPESVDTDAIKATYQEGLLHITLPKTTIEEGSEAKVIEIS